MARIDRSEGIMMSTPPHDLQCPLAGSKIHCCQWPSAPDALNHIAGEDNS